MPMVRRLSNGLSVFAAQRVSNGPPEIWVAIGTDSRTSPNAAVLGLGSTAQEAEVDAVVQLGGTPSAVRAAQPIRSS
jgi:hypothetical protein